MSTLTFLYLYIYRQIYTHIYLTFICADRFICTGAGEPNFDGLDANPYGNKKQKQEWEVKALLEKIQPELIGLNPGELGKVDHASFQRRHQDRVEALVSVWSVRRRLISCQSG